MTGNSTSTADERSLLRAAQAGDEQAFGRLVEPYRRALTIHSYRMLGSPHDAEDIVQETLLRAWRGLESYEPRAALASWLYRIATNASPDELERRPRRPQPVQPYPDTPLDVLGWSSAEVAELLETSVAAVNSALQRARQTTEQNLPSISPAPTARAERELLDRYVDAFERDDVDALVSLLREDATLRMPQPSVIGAVQIALFFRQTVAGGDLTRIRLAPTWANGRPAVAIQLLTEDRGLVPHGISVLEIEGEQIVGIDAFINPALLPRFGFRTGDRSGRSL